MALRLLCLSETLKCVLLVLAMVHTIFTLFSYLDLIHDYFVIHLCLEIYLLPHSSLQGPIVFGSEGACLSKHQIFSSILAINFLVDWVWV